MKKKYLVALIVAIAAMLGASIVWSAQAAPPDDKKCYETVVVEEAWTETIEGEPEVWANWAPNDTRGPQNYTPIWPEDDRGTWIVHNQLPPGHAGPNGVYQQGGGNSPWFYRHAGTDDKIVEHAAVTQEKEVPCPKGPVKPEPPEEKPEPKPDTKPDQVIVPVPEAPSGPVDRGGQTTADQPVAVPTEVAAGK